MTAILHASWCNERSMQVDAPCKLMQRCSMMQRSVDPYSQLLECLNWNAGWCWWKMVFASCNRLKLIFCCSYSLQFVQHCLISVVLLRRNIACHCLIFNADELLASGYPCTFLHCCMNKSLTLSQSSKWLLFNHRSVWTYVTWNMFCSISLYLRLLIETACFIVYKL